MGKFYDWARRHPTVFGLLISGIYGLLMRLFFFDPEAMKRLGIDDLFFTTSVGFLFGAPLVMGYLTMAGDALKPEQQNLSFGRSVLRAIFLPWGPAFFSFLVILLAGFELMICLIMAGPLFLLMSSLGGLLAMAVLSRKPKNYSSFLVGLVFLPMIGSGLESQLPQPHNEYKVHNQILIDAPADAVWKQIERVPMIQEQEQTHSYLHELGFPRPLEATLSQPGVGGVRHATFEGNILFVETVTEWNPPRTLSFSIVPELAESQSAIVNSKILGGKYFDILEGSYYLEPVLGKNGEQTLLHLSSIQRVSTFYNLYSSLWTRWVMSQLQSYILNVIQQRAEQATTARQ